MRYPIALQALILPLLVVACERAELAGPPELRVGRDECVECGMLIAEPEFACAFLVQEDRRRRHLIFDDIGCLLDVERTFDDATRVVDGFVRDHGDGEWVRTGAAFYLVADPHTLRTPMGTGIVAFATREAAESSAAEIGGEVLDHAGVAERRREWREARRRRYDGGS